MSVFSTGTIVLVTERVPNNEDKHVVRIITKIDLRNEENAKLQGASNRFADIRDI
jgi:hypothetical protein